MGDENGGFLRGTDDPADVRGDVQPGLVIQGAEGLIQQQNVRFHCHGAHQGGALLQPTGKLAGLFGQEGCEAVILRHGENHLFFLRRELVIDFQAEDDVPVYAAPLKQMVALQHVADSRLFVMGIFCIKSNVPGFRL